MEAKFYLVDEKHVDIHGVEKSLRDILYFSFKKESIGSKVPFEFDGKATKQHVQEHPQAFKAFKKEHPEFKLPWGEDSGLVGKKAQEIGEVTAAPQPKQESAPAEAGKEEAKQTS